MLQTADGAHHVRARRGMIGRRPAGRDGGDLHRAGERDMRFGIHIDHMGGSLAEARKRWTWVATASCSGPARPGPAGGRPGARAARAADSRGRGRDSGPARAARDAVLRAGLRLRRAAAQHPRALSGPRSRRGRGAGVHHDRQWPRELARLLPGGRSTRRHRRAVFPARVPPPALRRRRPRAGARGSDRATTISCTRTGSGTGRGGRRRVMRGGG